MINPVDCITAVKIEYLSMKRKKRIIFQIKRYLEKFHQSFMFIGSLQIMKSRRAWI